VSKIRDFNILKGIKQSVEILLIVKFDNILFLMFLPEEEALQ